MNKKTVILVFLTVLTLMGALSKNPIISHAESEPSEIVMEQTTGRILHQKNALSRRPIASLTKIMTAVIVLENTDIKRDFKIVKDCVGVEGSSIYLNEGEIYTIEDLLYGLMLRSGNDAAVALALATSGSLDKFVKLMNEKAEELNMTQTNFCNPHGLHERNHLSCARDVAIMLSYAMKNEQYRQIAKTLTHVATEKSSTQKTTFYNKNKLLKSYGFCTGGKTGYTKIAGRCLATTAEKNGMKLSCVVLGRQDTYEQSVALYEKAYSEYYMKNSIRKEMCIEHLKGILTIETDYDQYKHMLDDSAKTTEVAQ